MEMTQYACNKKPQPIKNYTANQQYTKTCKKTNNTNLLEVVGQRLFFKDVH